MTNFNIYTASAGSGKTYALVKEYLIKCFSSNDLAPYSKILAVTFTNKAASEMKSRIASLLNQPIDKLWLGTLNFADIEIRYKGSVMGEPQFFAVITDHFKSNYRELSTDKQKW